MPNGQSRVANGRPQYVPDVVPQFVGLFVAEQQGSRGWPCFEKLGLANSIVSGSARQIPRDFSGCLRRYTEFDRGLLQVVVLKKAKANPIGAASRPAA